MASIFIGINRGQNEMSSDSGGPGVVEGAATNSTDVELRIDTGKSLTRHEVAILTDAIIRYLLDGRTAVFPM